MTVNTQGASQQIIENMDAEIMSLNDELKIKDKRIEELEEGLETRDTSAVHSCSDYCERPICVLRRRVDELTELHKAILALEGSEGMTDAKFAAWVLAALKQENSNER